MFEQSEKLCKDCAYYSADDSKPSFIAKFNAVCTHPAAETTNLVTGEMEPTECRWMRNDTRCGGEGKLFSRKAEAVA